jgi:branched-chain amino acid transport system permease protein
MSALEINNLCKSFGGVTAVNRWSTAFDEGSITALIGPNGAGKTTAFNLISGFLKPDMGEVICHGRNITDKSPWTIAALGVGRLFQDVRVFNRMTVRDNVLTAFPRQSGENAFISIVKRLKVSKEQKELTTRADGLLEFVGLADKVTSLAENLSYGQQKLLALARLLATDANVLLLDEPTAGVSAKAGASLLGMIRRLSTEGKTTLIIEHNIDLVKEIADRVCFIEKGEITASGTFAEVLGKHAVRAAYIGIPV